MYAIVEIAGQQYKVRKDQQVYVHRLEGNEGDSVSFEKVLLTDDNGSVNVGAPVIEGLKVDAKIVSHLKGDKVIVFKKKRRKGYQKKNGHRQHLSLIEITGIANGGGSKTSAKKETAPAKEAPKAEAKKTETPKKETSKAEAKKPEAPKKEAPKAEAKKAEKPTEKKAYDGDLTQLKGVGPKKAESLEAAGYTLEKIAKLDEAGMEKLANDVDGISVDGIKSDGWVETAKEIVNQ